MTTEEWIESARLGCNSALDEPGIQRVKAMLSQANISQAEQREALRISATEQLPSRGLLKLQTLMGDIDPPVERFPLERKLLLEEALLALSRLNELPVDETVKQMFCKEFLFIAQPTEESLPRFALSGYTFVAMGKIVLLNRFPAGHYHWEVSGFPRSWLPKIPFHLLPATLRFLLTQTGGFKPWFVSHMRGTGPGTPFLVESEFKKSFYRMALALKKQPHIRAISADSWLHSPETHRVSPHLAFLNRIFVEAGGFVTDLGPASPQDGFAQGNKQRAELYRLGEYKPTIGVAMCSRAHAIAWAEEHPELETQITVK
jgi:hypothetical protein